MVITVPREKAVFIRLAVARLSLRRPGEMSQTGEQTSVHGNRVERRSEKDSSDRRVNFSRNRARVHSGFVGYATAELFGS